MDHAKSYLQHVRAFEEKEDVQKDFVIRKDGKLIGGVGVLYNFGVHSHKSEIGYWMSREFRGEGIMTDAIGAFVRHLFDTTQLVRLEANVFIGNHGSARVLEKNQFVLEGTLRAAFIKEGTPKDTWLYARVHPSLTSAELPPE
jgi:RimJ/RimL family protein N-acetyltransferase